jgi:hypothetical protein
MPRLLLERTPQRYSSRIRIEDFRNFSLLDVALAGNVKDFEGDPDVLTILT